MRDSARALLTDTTTVPVPDAPPESVAVQVTVTASGRSPENVARSPLGASVPASALHA